MKWARATLALLATVASGCTDRTTGEVSSDGGSGGTASDPSTTATTTTTSTPSGTETTSGTTSTTGPSSTTDDATSGSTGVPLDVGTPGCGAPPELNYLWVSNSDQGTISKVNLETMVEEGRYITRPDSAGSPSRTSVNLNGDVAVANREGGVAMFAARTEDCPDPANTSTGPDDVKAWPDGCLVWYEPFTADSQRPVAWTRGTYNEESCQYEGMSVWTSTHDTGTTVATVYLLDGVSGAVTDSVDVPGVQNWLYGLYGAAVDGAGNVWMSELQNGLLVNVAVSDMSVQTWPMPAPGYGMTVDSQGYVWTCSQAAARFDPVTQMWAVSDVLTSSGNGCMEDGNGTLWIAADPIVGVDVDTVQEVTTLAVPERVRGVSLDSAGYLWGVSIVSQDVYRVDPTTGAVDTVTGFNYPYIYSDMTGFGLANAG